MSLTLSKSFKGTVYSAYWRTYSPITYNHTDTNFDDKKPLTRTPRGKWRPPTSYYRNVDIGDIYCYHIAGSDAYTDGYGTWSNQGSGYRICSGYYYAAAPSFPSELEDKAITRALTNLKGQKVNLAQAFAERGQTTRLVGDTIRRITDLVLDIRRTKRALARTDKDFFKYFLEVQYGWKPAMQDVYGAVKELHEREQQSARGVVTVKANVRENLVDDAVLSDSISNSVYFVTRRRRIKHTGHIRLDYLQNNGAPVGTFSRLGITNPALIAWELTPWSFVADWFVPVGDYLSLLDATLGWTFQGGSFSSKTTVDIRPVNVTPRYEPSMPNRKFNYSAWGQGRQMRFNRKAYSSSPFPNRPHLKTNSSGIHVANGIALLMAAITGARGVR